MTLGLAFQTGHGGSVSTCVVSSGGVGTGRPSSPTLEATDTASHTHTEPLPSHTQTQSCADTRIVTSRDTAHSGGRRKPTLTDTNARSVCFLIPRGADLRGPAGKSPLLPGSSQPPLGVRMFRWGWGLGRKKVARGLNVPSLSPRGWGLSWRRCSPQVSAHPCLPECRLVPSSLGKGWAPRAERNAA